MVEDQLNNAIDGFTTRDPVMGAVIIVLIIAIALVFKIMNDFRKEAEAKLVKEQEAHDKTRAEQREDFRNMSHVTKTLEGLSEKVGELQKAQQELARDVIRSKP